MAQMPSSSTLTVIPVEPGLYDDLTKTKQLKISEASTISEAVQFDTHSGELAGIGHATAVATHGWYDDLRRLLDAKEKVDLLSVRCTHHLVELMLSVYLR